MSKERKTSWAKKLFGEPKSFNIKNSNKEVIQEELYSEKMNLSCSFDSCAMVVEDLLLKETSFEAQNFVGNRAIHSAAIKGNCAAIKVLSKNGAALDSRNYFGQSAIHLAVIKNKSEAVKTLAEEGANLESKEYHGYTALHVAALEQNEYMGLLLLNSGAQVDVLDNNGRTPQYYAARNNNPKLCYILKKFGADANKQDEFGISPKKAADYLGNHKALDELRDKDKYLSWEAVNRSKINELFDRTLPKGEEYDQPESNAARPKIFTTNQKLHIAIKKKDYKEYQKAIKEGADVNAEFDSGYTPLYVAVYKGACDIVKDLLFSHGISPKQLGIKGVTPLHIAASKGDKNTISLLCKAGADIEYKSASNLSAIHYSALHGHTSAAARLIDLGASPNSIDDLRKMPIHIAAYKGHSEFVSFIADKGSDIDAKDSIGVTALHIAVMRGHNKLVSILLTKGADLNIKSEAGCLPIHYAAYKGHLRIIKDLLVASSTKYGEKLVLPQLPEIPSAIPEQKGAKIKANFEKVKSILMQKKTYFTEDNDLNKCEAKICATENHAGFTEHLQENDNAILGDYLDNGEVVLYSKLT